MSQENSDSEQDLVPHKQVTCSAVHLKKTESSTGDAANVVSARKKSARGTARRRYRDLALAKLFVVPKLRFLVHIGARSGLKLSFLAQKERSAHSLYCTLTPYADSSKRIGNDLYVRLYHGADFLGDAFETSANGEQGRRQNNALLYCTAQNPVIPIIPARIYPHLGQTLILSIESLPRSLSFPSSFSQYSFSRPLLRMAVCSLSASGHVHVLGNCYTHPLFGRHYDLYDLYDLPDPTTQDGLIFSADNHNIYVKVDMLVQSRLFLLFEFTFLAQVKGGKDTDMLFEVTRGVSFLRLSPMKQFSSKFLDTVRQRILSLPSLGDRQESKQQYRRAEDDFLRISDLLDILETVGHAQSEEKFAKTLQAVKKNSKHPDKQKPNPHHYSPFSATSLDLPVFEYSISDQLTTLIDGSPYKHKNTRLDKSRTLRIRIKPIPIHDIGSISRLPKTIIVPPRCLALLDHVTAGYATMLTGPRSCISRTEPQLGRLCVKSTVTEDVEHDFMALLRSTSGNRSQFAAEIATLDTVLRSFGRFRPIVSGASSYDASGSPLLYFFATLFDVRINEVPKDIRHYMNQSILPPVSLGINDNICLGTFIRFLRQFRHILLKEVISVATDNKNGAETAWDSEASHFISLLEHTNYFNSF